MAPIFTGLKFGFGRVDAEIGGAAQGLTATGGTITTPGNGYRYHAFTTPGPATFTVTGIGIYGSTVEYLVVGGGGAGGADRSGGGGGAGGLRTATGFPVSTSPGSYAITVGAGAVLGGNGSPSIFSSITSQGGGRGGTDPDFFGPTNGTGFPGGSGGGARSNSPGASGGSGNSVTGTSTPAPSQGNPGGPNTAGSLGGAGGGGAGAAGAPVGPGSGGSAGGAGLQYPQFTGPLIGVPSLAPLSGYFAGGGGGGNVEPMGGTFAPGGLGGGGRGQSGDSGTSPLPGTTNSGGGGGGAGPSSGGGTGGPGIVVIRYLV